MSRERFTAEGPAGKLAGFVEGSGGGLPLVLVHGINMSSDVWSDVASRLAPSRKVIAVDLRGHGGSARQGPFGADDYAADVITVMDHLGIERAHVVGTSFGGSVACAVAVKAPQRVASIAAFGSALAIPGLDVESAVEALRSAGVRDFFAGFLPQASFAPGTDPALVERALAAAATDRDVETVIEVSKTALGSDLTELGSRVRVPALVVTGELDATCPVAAGEAMAKILAARFEVVPGRGHVLSMEDPDTVVRLVVEHATAHEASA